MKEIRRRRVDVWEVEYEGGAVGLLVNGCVHMGVSEKALQRLLAAVFPYPTEGEPIDGDLLELAQMYLASEDSANERQQELLF